MHLISTQDLVLIGPGSEWFWTALSGVVLAVTFVAIYRQLRVQASQAAIEQLEAFTREWQSERFLAYRLEVYLALKEGTDPDKLPDMASERLANYWEGVGALVRSGHLDRRLLWQSNGSVSRLAWALLGPWCLAGRAADKDPKEFENFEWLVGVMTELDRRSGSEGAFDQESLMAGLDARIASARQGLQIERSLRSTRAESPPRRSSSAAPSRG